MRQGAARDAISFVMDASREVLQKRGLLKRRNPWQPHADPMKDGAIPDGFGIDWNPA
jgi:hypothetical protein